MTSVCNTGAMAQIAGAQNSALMNVLHGSSTVSSFLYSYKPEAMYAIDTDTLPLQSGNLTNNASETYEAEVPNTFDLVSGCTIVLNVPAIVNVSSGVCDIAGSATNSSSAVDKIRAYVDGPESDAATKDRHIVARATTVLGSEGTNQTGYLTFESGTLPATIKQGDYFEAYSTGQITETGTIQFDAANTTALAASRQFTVTTASFPKHLQNNATGTLTFLPTFNAVTIGSTSNFVRLNGTLGNLVFTSAVGSATIANIAVANADKTFNVSFTFANPAVGDAPPLVGRIGRIDTTNYFVYDRHATAITKKGGAQYHTIFSRDTNLNSHVGDSTVEIPCSDPDVQFTKYYADGPNMPSDTAQGMLCPAAGFKSDIAAYYQPWAPVQFIQSATLSFDGVCADTMTGTAIQIYYDLHKKECDKNERLLNACTDTRVLKARARQPQQFEVPLPFSFFRDNKRALNMERFKYTTIKLKLVTTPYSRMIANGCGSSDFKLTITSDNALGGSTARTLVTKAGAQVGSTHAFCDSKTPITYASASTIVARDIGIKVRWTGFYLPKADRERLTKLMPTHMVVQQHSVSEPVTVTTAALQKIDVPGNNALSSVVLVAQTRSAVNHGRYWDFGGHAIAGTGTRSGAFVERAPLLESVRLQCQGKNRTQEHSAIDVGAIAFEQGAAANAKPTTDYYAFMFGTTGPYDSAQNMNAQQVPDIKVEFKARPAVFQNNSPTGGLDGKTKVASSGSSAVDGGEAVLVRVLTTQHNLIRFDHDSVRFEYPC
jgi:hypothetical protein